MLIKMPFAFPYVGLQLHIFVFSYWGKLLGEGVIQRKRSANHLKEMQASEALGFTSFEQSALLFHWKLASFFYNIPVVFCKLNHLLCL